MTIVKEFKALNLEIQKKFGPLSWVDITHFDNGTGSISFTDCGEDTDEFLRLCMTYLENKGYEVYIGNSRYNYNNASQNVQPNELLIAFKNDK